MSAAEEAPDDASPRGSPISIPATDGYALAATLFDAPDAGAAGLGRPTVILSPATGVRRKLYDRFAAHLSSEGFRVVTFDYRGVGDSRPASLRGFVARVLDWGEKDLAGIIAWAVTAAAPTLVIGHSIGGQLVGLAPNNTTLAGLLAVAAQSGYWGHWPVPRKYLMAALWYGLMPGLTAACGYFPARRLGLGEDLPAGVALEWARWCRSPAYLAADDGFPLRRRFAALAAPVHAYSFEGDPYAPRLRRRGYPRSLHRRHLTRPPPRGPPRDRGEAPGAFRLLPRRPGANSGPTR